MTFFPGTVGALAMVLVALPAGLAAQSGAPVAALQHPDPEQTVPSQAPAAAEPVLPPHSAPLEIMHGKPYVMVLVNGQGPFRFMVDSGTSAAMIVSPSLVERLSLITSGQVHLVDPSGIGNQQTTYVLIDSLDVAGQHFNLIEGLEHSVPSQDGNCDGLLGFSLFQDYLLTIDYPRRRMTVETGEVTPDGGSSVVPIRIANGLPMVTLHIGEVDVEAVVDSGGSGLSLPESLLPRLKLTTLPVFFGKEQSLTAWFIVKTANLGMDIQLGRYTFERPFIEVIPTFPVANFGAGPMGNFSITFDQQKRLMRLESPRTVLHLDAPPPHLHFEETPADDPPAPHAPSGEAASPH